MTKREVFDLEKARNASKEIDKLRESNSFNKGNKKGVEIIREWRNKRRAS